MPLPIDIKPVRRQPIGARLPTFRRQPTGGRRSSARMLRRTPAWSGPGWQRYTGRGVAFRQTGPGGHGRDLAAAGAGTGYNAALLAELAADVVTVDVDPRLADDARARLAERWPGVRVAVGDGMLGWPDGAPYDRIVVTATPPHIPAAWRDQLREGGLLEVPMLLGRGSAGVQAVVTFR